jgi:uncharacterized C2H2 Zn-finger protein
MSKSEPNIHHVTFEEIGEKVYCPHCHKAFTLKTSYNRHLSGDHCAVLREQRLFTNFSKQMADQFTKMLDQRDVAQAQKDAAQAQQLAEISEKISKTSFGPYVDNSTQNLNIVCLGSSDNLLDILASSEGLPNALTYIKGCALSRIAGDCRILERVYKLDTEKAALMYVTKSKTKFVYYDERQRRTVETNSKVMAKKLADIVQRSYLKGMESLKTDLLGNMRESDDSISQEIRDQLPELAPYDIQIWNAHIHELADEKYQKKLLSNLKIPIEVRVSS